MPKMSNSNYSTVITVDMQESLIRFFSMTAGNEDSITQETKKCKARLFDKSFYDTFQGLITEYAGEHPSAQAAGVTIVLPDRAVATNMLSIPTLRRKKTGESLSVAINELYKNAAELKINYHVTIQNRQFTSYSLSMIRNDILSSIYSACSTSKMIPQAVTFSANAAVNGVQNLMPKLKNASYLLMDIKLDYTRFSFVTNGRTTGYYILPFGYSILDHYRLAAEDMLFDHSPAELLVLNAKEKAQAKSLTLGADGVTQMAQEMAEAEEEAAQSNAAQNELDDEDEIEEDGSINIFSSNSSRTFGNKTLPQKQPRKLPKFMVREVEHTEEAYAYENFRLFEKWALNLVQTNAKQLWSDRPEAIYVNMPKNYNYLLDKANEEKKDNGMVFLPLEVQGINDNILSNLESYGGFFTGMFNSSNNF